jgi:hypothetical protein
MAASESKYSVATRWYGDAPPGAWAAPSLTSYFFRPGIFLASGTCVAK